MSPSPVGRDEVAGAAAAKPNDNPNLAVAYMLLAAAVLPTINACAKALDGFPVVQITWARYAGHFLFMIAVFAPTHGIGMLRSTRPSLQLLRSALHCASAVITFTALGSVALPTATAISFTAPLIVTALAPFLLGERLTGDRAFAVALGFLGALVIVRPGLGGWNLAIGMLLLNAVASANVQILSRKVSGYDRAVTSNTYMVLIGFVLTSLPLPFVWRTPDTEHAGHRSSSASIGRDRRGRPLLPGQRLRARAGELRVALQLRADRGRDGARLHDLRPASRRLDLDRRRDHRAERPIPAPARAAARSTVAVKTITVRQAAFGTYRLSVRATRMPRLKLLFVVG